MVQPLKRPNYTFTSCTKIPNANNFSYNCKTTRTTSDVRPIICVSSTKERKTQVRWDITIRQKTQK